MFPTLPRAYRSISLFSVKRIILVSGKLYYDLIKERSARSLDSNVAIVRIEELCPFPKDDIIQELKKYKNADKVVWCQEEPRNMGAWSFMEGRLELCLGRKVG